MKYFAERKRRDCGITSKVVMASVSVLSVALLMGASAARGQDNVQLVVPKLVIAKPGQQTELGINFEPSIPTGRSLLLRVVGFDPKVRLLSGYRVNKGVWAVPLASAQALKFTLPQSVTKDQSIQIALTSIDGDLVAQAQTTVRIDPGSQTFASTVPASTVTRSGDVIAPKLLQEGTAAQAAPNAQQKLAARDVTRQQASPQQAAPQKEPLQKQALNRTQPTTNAAKPVTRNEQASPVPVLSAENRARAERLLKRGNDFLRQGQITQARLLFKSAAELGLAAAALALGGTYDPQELNRLRVVGITPDMEQAKKWYGLAVRLGSTKAAARLTAAAQR